MKKQVNFHSIHKIFYMYRYMNIHIYNLLIPQCIYYRGSYQYIHDEDNLAGAWIHSSRTMVIHTINYILNAY